MKKLLSSLLLTVLTPCLMAPAYAQLIAPANVPQPSGMTLSLELLSDTNGANIDPYVKSLISDLTKHWLPLAKEAVSERTKRPEETLIGFTIAPDGQILAMQLEDSTHDTALDKAAWKATTGTAYSPLPRELKDSNLKLRVHFVVN
jgi:TonB family protein